MKENSKLLTQFYCMQSCIVPEKINGRLTVWKYDTKHIFKQRSIYFTERILFSFEKSWLYPLRCFLLRSTVYKTIL